MTRRKLIQSNVFKNEEKEGAVPCITFQTQGEKWAWFAGLVDGEGTFSIGRAGDGKVSVLLRVEMKTYEIIEFLTLTFGGSFSETKKGGGKVYYIFVLSTDKVRWVLPYIRPYLIVKAKEADLIQRLLDAKTSNYDTKEFTQSIKDGLRALHPEKSEAGDKGNAQRIKNGSTAGRKKKIHL